MPQNTPWYSRQRACFDSCSAFKNLSTFCFFELPVALMQPPFVDLTLCANIGLVVQDNTQEGIVDAKPAVVLDEAQLPEFVHEKIDPWACCVDHLRQHLLRYFGKYLLRLVRRAITREQQTGCVPAVSRWS
jgi:hypothetical protein